MTTLYNQLHHSYLWCQNELHMSLEMKDTIRLINFIQKFNSYLTEVLIRHYISERRYFDYYVFCNEIHF